jgi:hypothetical protein
MSTYYDLGVARDLLHEAVGDVARVAVEQADPVDLRVLELPKQLIEDQLLVEVEPVGRRVLGDEVDLLGAVGRELVDLAPDDLHGLRAELAADLGDHAEGARMVAPLREPDVRGVARSEADPVAVDLELGQLGGDEIERPGGFRLLQDRGADLGDLLPVGDAQDRVDAVEALLEVGPVALGKAAGDDHGLEPTLALELDHGLDRVHRLLLGGGEEAAGVDDDDVRLLVVGAEVESPLGQVSQEDLAVHEVLGAPERDEGDAGMLHGGPDYRQVRRASQWTFSRVGRNPSSAEFKNSLCSASVSGHNRHVAGKGSKKTRLDAVKLLPEVIRRLLAISDADLLLHEVCSLASDALGADEVSLLLTDASGEELIEHEGVGKKLRPTRFRLKMKDEGISGSAAVKKSAGGARRPQGQAVRGVIPTSGPRRRADPLRRQRAGRSQLRVHKVGYFQRRTCRS